jgi:hypothetical protein
VSVAEDENRKFNYGESGKCGGRVAFADQLPSLIRFYDNRKHIVLLARKKSSLNTREVDKHDAAAAIDDDDDRRRLRDVFYHQLLVKRLVHTHIR